MVTLSRQCCGVPSSGIVSHTLAVMFMLIRPAGNQPASPSLLLLHLRYLWGPVAPRARAIYRECCEKWRDIMRCLVGINAAKTLA